MHKLKLPIVPEQRDETEVKTTICLCSKKKQKDFIPLEAIAWFADTLNQ